MILGAGNIVARKIPVMILVLIGTCASGSSFAQTQNSTQSNEKKAEGLLRSKKYSFQDLLSGKPEAVADAKQIFELSGDLKVRLRAASILVRIGKADQIHYDYLTAQAKQALDYANSMPWPTLYDRNGDIVPKKVNPQFLKWCEAHKLNALQTFEDAYYEIPIPWYFLAAASDPRSYNLFIKGLHSKNIMISAWAADGLARIHASQAIDEIIAVGQRAPLESRGEIGKALLYFPESRAQAAADVLIKDKKTLALERTEAKSKGIAALFPW